MEVAPPEAQIDGWMMGWVRSISDCTLSKSTARVVLKSKAIGQLLPNCLFYTDEIIILQF